jgi:hypothetical protein
MLIKLTLNITQAVPGRHAQMNWRWQFRVLEGRRDTEFECAENSKSGSSKAREQSVHPNGKGQRR